MFEYTWVTGLLAELCQATDQCVRHVGFCTPFWVIIGRDGRRWRISKAISLDRNEFTFPLWVDEEDICLPKTFCVRRFPPPPSFPAFCLHSDMYIGVRWQLGCHSAAGDMTKLPLCPVHDLKEEKEEKRHWISVCRRRHFCSCPFCHKWKGIVKKTNIELLLLLFI